MKLPFWSLRYELNTYFNKQKMTEWRAEEQKAIQNFCTLPYYENII
jgi:hypothetical protein